MGYCGADLKVGAAQAAAGPKTGSEAGLVDYKMMMTLGLGWLLARLLEAWAVLNWREG